MTKETILKEYGSEGIKEQRCSCSQYDKYLIVLAFIYLLLIAFLCWSKLMNNNVHCVLRK